MCNVCNKNIVGRLFKYITDSGKEISVCESCEDLTNYDFENDRPYLDLDEERYY